MVSRRAILAAVVGGVMDPVGLDQAIHEINQVTIPAVRELLMAMVAQIRLEGDAMRQFLTEERGRVMAEVAALHSEVTELRKMVASGMTIAIDWNKE